MDTALVEVRRPDDGEAKARVADVWVSSDGGKTWAVLLTTWTGIGGGVEDPTTVVVELPVVKGAYGQLRLDEEGKPGDA